MRHKIALPILLFLFMFGLFIYTRQEVNSSPHSQPNLTISPDCIDQKIAHFTVTGTNWTPDETIQLRLDNQLLTARTPTHSGNFSLTWQMPSPAQGGHIVEAYSNSFHSSTPLWVGCALLSTLYLPLIQTSETASRPAHEPRPFAYLEMGSLSADHLAFNQMFADIDLHQFEITDSGTLTISAVTDLGQDISLALVDTTTDQIVGQNLVQGNEIETAVFPNLNPAHTYHLNINNPTQADTDYIALVWGDEGIQLEAKDILEYGEIVSATIPASDMVRHFYFFYGQAGDIVSINTTTEGITTTAMVISVYDVNGDYLESDGDELLFIDEEISDILLPETGLYTLWLEELDYDMANYTVTVTKE